MGEKTHPWLRPIRSSAVLTYVHECNLITMYVDSVGIREDQMTLPPRLDVYLMGLAELSQGTHKKAQGGRTATGFAVHVRYFDFENSRCWPGET